MRLIKPALDVVLAAALLVLLSPVMLAVAMAILCVLGRPVLFRQQRIGRGGCPFVMLKYRTMRRDRRLESRPVTEERRSYHKSDDDPRHTPLGRFLRRHSLDELPQLINVMRGEMSLVGPRPELAAVVMRYAGWEHERHGVRPGLTGLWQVSARGEGRMHEFTYLDVEYVRTVNPLVDLKILVKTGPALVQRRGH